MSIVSSPLSVSSPPASSQPPSQPTSVPRVILRLAYPHSEHESKGEPELAEDSAAIIADLTRRLHQRETEATQLRSSLRNANRGHRMLEAQMRENSRRVRKEVAGIRAACWAEVQSFKASHKAVTDDLRYLKYERRARRVAQEHRDAALALVRELTAANIQVEKRAENDAARTTHAVDARNKYYEKVKGLEAE
eukprot:3094359-Pleurochrysis_carterae.AAC.1